MRKGFVLATVFVLVVGIIGWRVIIPHHHTFENIPISIEYSWHVGEFSGFKEGYLFYSDYELNIPIPRETPKPYDSGTIIAQPNVLSGYIPICLDLNITNHSNKTIKNIRAYFDVGGYLPDGTLVSYGTVSGLNLLWDISDSVNDWISPNFYHNGTLSLRGGETKTIRLLVHMPHYQTSLDLSEAEILNDIEDFLDSLKFETNLYISWIQYAGFGGQWGEAFSLTQWGGTYEFDPELGGVIINEPPANVAKIHTGLFQR